MDEIKVLEGMLKAFPLWKEDALDIDDTQPIPGLCGLFPQGVQVLSRQEDVTGNVRLRLRESFLLRRVAPRGTEAASWLRQLQSWLQEKQVTGFGEDCVVHAEKGKLSQSRQTGTDIYEVTITVEYTKENKYGEN